MELGDFLQLTLVGLVMAAIFNSVVAAYSYAYYVRKTGAPVESRNNFQSTLRAPSKWLFSGQKPVIERAILSKASSYKTLDEFLQNATLFEIQFPRIISSVVSLFATVGLLVVLLVIEKLYLQPAHIVYLLIQLSIWIASFRFGHLLVSLSN